MCNNHSSTYNNHLPNITTPTPQQNQSSGVWGVATSEKLPSFRNFLNQTNRSPQPMHVAQDNVNVANTTSHAVNMPIGTQKNNSFKRSTQEVNKNSENKIRIDEPSGNIIASSSQDRVHNQDQDQGPHTEEAEAEVLHAPMPQPSSTETMMLSLNQPSHHDMPTMVNSPIQDLQQELSPDNLHHLQEVEGERFPNIVHLPVIPLLALPDQPPPSSDRPNFLEISPYGRHSKEKIQDSLKNALQAVLDKAEKNTVEQSNQQNSRVIPTGPAHGSSINQRNEAPSGNVSNPVVGSRAQITQAPLRRIPFREADRIARETEIFARAKLGKRPRSDSFMEPNLPFAPVDPQLASSFDAMALEHARGTLGSSSRPSLIRMITGKRPRDSGQVIRNPDQPSTSPAGFAGFTRGSMNGSHIVHNRGRDMQGNCTEPTTSAQDKHALPETSNSQSIKNQSTGSLRSLLETTNANSGSELDLLASVVVSQGVPIYQRRICNVNGRTPVASCRSNQGRTRPGALANSALVSQSMSVNKNDIDETRAIQVATRASSQPNQSIVQEINQTGSASQGQTAHASSVMPITPRVEDILCSLQNGSPLANSEDDPKSEVSYTDEEEIPSVQPLATQEQVHQMTQHQVTEDIAPVEEDEISPARHIVSSQVLPSEISPAEQIPFLETPEGTRVRVRMPEDLDEITPTPTTAMRPRHSSYSPPSQTRRNRRGSSKEQEPPRQVFPPTTYLEDEITPAPPPAPQRRNEFPGAGSSSAAPPGSSKEGKGPVRERICEDVSEITPAPPRPKRARAYQAGLSSQRVTTNAAASSAQGVPGASGRSNTRASRSRSRTTLPYTFRCELCGAMFNRRFNLNKHIRNVHQNIRKFKCTLCEERFLQKSHREAHLLAVHHKIRPFVCQFCSKNFSWLGVLRKHLQAIHKVNVKTTKRARRSRARAADVVPPQPTPSGQVPPQPPPTDQVPPQLPPSTQAAPTPPPSDETQPPSPPSDETQTPFPPSPDDKSASNM